MRLTIPELARAVDKSENYVRQHIHRKHLTVQKDGRNISVALDEASRWARERHLPFEPPVNAWAPMGATTGRAARMTVLALSRPEKTPSNLLTVLRHRRQDALGPWANEPSKNWTSEDLGNGLRLYSLDAPLEHCEELVQEIVEAATLTIDDEQIDYALEPNPRRHRAFRDQRGLADAPMISPFPRHSAEIVEYWCLAEEPLEHWLDVLKSRKGHAPPQLSRLRIPLDRFSDRAGNLIIAGAEDAIACDLAAGHDRTLRLHVDADDLPPGAYRATIWASHAGDEVLRQEVSITQSLTAIELASDVDHIGFAIFRTVDGQCIDLMEAYLILQISGQLRVNSSSTLQFRGKQRRLFHEVNPPGPSSRIDIRFDDESGKHDKEIRQRWLDRRLREREAAARRAGNFERFPPAAFGDAVAYFIDLLRQDVDQKTPIFLADPYFETQLMGNAPKDLDRKKLYLDIFATTAGAPLQILCAKKEPEQGQGDPPPWWSECPEQITSHVHVRSFRRRDRQEPGFHDRFLITPRREIIITNSIRGWHTHGVTFASFPSEVYRAEADRLWNMAVGSQTTDLLVREIGR